MTFYMPLSTSQEFHPRQQFSEEQSKVAMVVDNFWKREEVNRVLERCLLQGTRGREARPDVVRGL